MYNYKDGCIEPRGGNMPYINIRVGKHLDEGERVRLHKETTLLMHTVMKKQPQVTVVNIEESDPRQWAVNTTTLTTKEPTGAYVDIKVTDRTNTSEEKAEMIAKTVKMLKDVVGIIQEACYVVIDDIPADSWGYNGRTQAARATIKQ
jgi:4-oxalocrotonate tautomerase